MKQKTLPLLLWALAALLVEPSLRAQEARLASTPPLGEALPFVTSPDGVRLKSPVLLNAHTVLGTNAVLRLVYIDPNAGLHLKSGKDADDQGVQGAFLPHHHSGGFGADSESGAFESGSSSSVAFPSDGGQGRKDVAQEVNGERWKDPAPFRETLDAAADLGTTVVYSVPGKKKLLTAEIDLPDGMLLSEIGNQITVLALTSDSKAFQGGLKPGDEIRLIDGQASPGSLEQFIQLYQTVTEQAQKAGRPYSFQVWRPAASKLMMIQVGAPPTIPSLF
jgi:hypothetical protein